MATEQDGFIIPDNVLEIQRELEDKRKAKEPKPEAPGVAKRATKALGEALAPAPSAPRERGGLRDEAKPYVAGDARVQAKPEAPTGENASVLDRVDTGKLTLQGFSQAEMDAGSVAPEKAAADRAQANYLNKSGAPVARPPGQTLNLSGRAGESVADATGSKRLGSLAETVTDAALLAPEAMTTTLKLGTDIANLASLGAAQPVSEWLGQTITAIQGAKSDRFQAKRAEFAGLMKNPDAGVMDIVTFMATNPRYAAELGVPSIPSMLLGASGARIGAALMAGRGAAETGAKIGAGAANVAMNAGSTFTDTQGDLGQKLAAAGAAGAGTALLGRLGGAETALATGKPGNMGRTLLDTGIREGLQEGGESLSQSLGQGTAEGNFDLGEAMKGAATEGIIGGVIGAGAGATSSREQQQPLRSAEEIARSKGFLNPAKAKAAALTRLDDVASLHGIPSAIVAKIKAAADGKPLAELGGWMKRALGNLAQAGAIPPIDPANLSALDAPPDEGDFSGLDEGRASSPDMGAANPDIRATGPDTKTGIDPQSEPVELDNGGQPKPIEGPKLNRNWTAFAPESGTLNIPRAQMPQIKAEHRGALVNFLKGHGVASEADEVRAIDLKPTQGEFSPQKVQRAATFPGGDRSILVSSDGFVLDGHHQWLAKRDADLPVKVIRLDAPIQDLMRLAHQFPSSFTAKGAPRADTGNGSPRTEGVAGAGPADAGRAEQPGGVVPGDAEQLGAGGSAGSALQPAGQRSDAAAPGSTQGNDALTEIDAALGDLAALFGKQAPGAPASAPATTGDSNELSKTATPQASSTVQLAGPPAKPDTKTPAPEKKLAPEYMKEVAAARDEANANAKAAPRETINPSEDKIVGTNDAGETLHDRKDGSRYRMHDGRPVFGGDLSPSKAAPSGPVAETFSGIHGEGMAEHIAKVKLRELGRTRPDLQWSIADAVGNPKYKADRYVVEGRKAAPQSNDAPAGPVAAAAPAPSPAPAGVPAAAPAAADEAARVDRTHLDALELRLSNERKRLSNAKTEGEKKARRVTVAGVEREIAGERKLLGLPTQEEVAADDDELLAELSAPAAAPKATKAPKPFKHPGKIRGSFALAEISKQLGGISPDLLADLTQKVSRTRVGKLGKQTRYTAWDNPMAAGVGPLFRAGGTSDLTELARVLEEAGYIAAGTLERDYGEARNLAQDIIKAELNEGGSSVDANDTEGLQARADRENEMAMDRSAELSAEDDFLLHPDDLVLAGMPSDFSAEDMDKLQELANLALDLGIDMDTFKEDFFNESNPEWSQPEYDAALIQAIEEAIARSRGVAGQPDAEEAGASDQVGGQDGANLESAGSDRADGSDETVQAEGLTGKDLFGARSEDVGGAKQDLEAKREALIDLENRMVGMAGLAPGFVEEAMRSRKVPKALKDERDQLREDIRQMREQVAKLDMPGLTLKAETEADAKAKAEREAQALASDKRKREIEQERLRREAEAKDIKARVGQTVDDFQLGQTASQQLSGMDDLFAQPGVPTAADVLKSVRRYASGMSRVGDLSTGSRAVGGLELRGIGVDVGELSAAGIEVVANAVINQSAALFVDSGAFSAFRRGLKSGDFTPLDFDAILAKYDQISEAIHDANPAEKTGHPRPLMVMPDVVGDQAESIRLVERYAKWINVEATSNVMRPIIPIQMGELSMAEAYRQIVEILGTDNFIVGIPSNEKAVGPAELTKFLREAQPKAMHVLGAAADAKLLPRLQSVVDAGLADKIEVTADASPIRSRIISAVAAGAKRGDVITAELYDEADPAAAPRGNDEPAEAEGLIEVPPDEAALASMLADLAHEQTQGEETRWKSTFAPDIARVSLPRVTAANPIPKGMALISTEEAAERLAEWKAEAARQGRELVSANANRTVISLFDASGVMSQPWVDAGYNVINYDLQLGDDIKDFDAETLMQSHGNDEVWAIIAQPPCTDFASSGAQWWKSKDEDGRTEASNELVRQAIRTIELFRPPVWWLENPVGRIRSLNKLPEPLLAFDPWHFGDPYTKRTEFYGKFDPKVPTAPVEPVEGSKMHRMSSSAKYERSLTPEGSAYAMFMVNNADVMGPAGRLAQEFAGIERSLFDAAVAGGTSEYEIRAAIEDSYYEDDLESVNGALTALGGVAPQVAPAEAPAWHTAIPATGMPVLSGDGGGDGPRSVVARIAKDAAEAITQVQQMSGEPLYAYVKPSTELHHGIVRLFPDDQTPPAPWRLLLPDSMRPGMLSAEQFAAKLTGPLAREPVLSSGEHPNANIPEAIKGRVKSSLQALQRIHKELAEVDRWGGPVELANRVRDRQAAIDASTATLAKFRSAAKKNGTDAKALIEELGGEPDFSRFLAPAVSSKKAAPKQAPAAGKPGASPDINQRLAALNKLLECVLS